MNSASFFDQQFTAKDVKALAGLEYWQLKDWDSRGVVGANRRDTSSWRKLSATQLIALVICAQLRDEYSIQVRHLRKLHQLLTGEASQDVRNHVCCSEPVWMFTDLQTQAAIRRKSGLNEILASEFFDDRAVGGICVNLTPIFNRVEKYAASRRANDHE